MIEIPGSASPLGSFSWRGTGSCYQLLQDVAGMCSDKALVVDQVGWDTGDTQFSATLPVTIDVGLAAT